MKHLSKNYSSLLTYLLLLLMSPMTVFSDVPSVISYSGQLADGSGDLIGSPTPTNVSLEFKIYLDDGAGGASGSALWTELHPTVIVTDGLFAVSLGSINTVLGSLKFDVPYVLGINVNSDGEMGLLRLSSAPTALRTENTTGSSIAVNCATDSIQDALDAGATTITIDGICTEAVSITRSGVTLIAKGIGIDGIEGPADTNPALNIEGANNVVISGLTLSEDVASVDESCVQVISGANVTFSSVTVESCSDIGVQVLLKSSVEFNGTANSITASNIGLELVAGSSAAITNMTISGFADEGIAVVGSSFAYLGDDGAAGVTISATATDATGLLIEGSSSVEMEGAIITSTNGNGAFISGKSNLKGLGEGTANNISGSSAGVFVLSGSVEIESGDISFSSVDANGV